jgi:hypothetical protein
MKKLQNLKESIGKTVNTRNGGETLPRKGSNTQAIMNQMIMR